MSTPQYSYPATGDWQAWLAARSPNTLHPSPQWDLLAALADPIREIDNVAAGTMYGLDPEVAVGWQLDCLGSWLAEPRSGLGDREYRQIIQARRQSQATGCTVESIWAVWLALTGADAGDAQIVQYPGAGAPLIGLDAAILIPPTFTFLRRGWQVLRDAVAYPLEFRGTMHVSGNLTWNQPPPWNQGTWGFMFVGS